MLCNVSLFYVEDFLSFTVSQILAKTLLPYYWAVFYACTRRYLREFHRVRLCNVSVGLMYGQTFTKLWHKKCKSVKVLNEKVTIWLLLTSCSSSIQLGSLHLVK